MVKARRYVVKKRFEGLPKRSDYEIVEEELPPLKNGEILVKSEWISVDPYLRAHSDRFAVPYTQFAFQVGIVEDSKDPRFPVGTRVVSHKGWCDYYLVDTNETDDPVEKVHKLPNMKNLSNSLGVGALGMPGATAYCGFLELGKPKAGETVVVSGAAGAVGSLVGQIAKIKGCKVIGIAGSDDKVRWLEEIGFHKALNYKSEDISAALKAAAPEGVDVYFDNVGGEISSIVINQMRDFGRVAVCGSISAYNADSSNAPKASIIQPALVFRQIRVEGFSAWRWLDRWPEAFSTMQKWIQNGELKPREHITEGFDNLFDAFVGMLKGDNFGKAVVKV